MHHRGAMRLLFCAICFFAPLSLVGGERIETGRTVAKDAAITIHVGGGRFRIVGGAEDQMQLAGVLGDGAKDVQIDVSEDGSQVQLSIPDASSDAESATDFDIRVPESSSIQFAGVSGQVDFETLRGNLDVSTVSGKIVAKKIAGNMTIRSLSGDIDIRESQGRVEARSSGGRISAQLDGANHEFNSGSGDITLVLGTIERLKASSINGNIEVSARLAETGEIQLESVNGDCQLTLPDSISAQINARTGPGGIIINELDGKHATEIFPATKRLSTTLGAGTGRISAESVTGDIRLQREVN